QRIHRTRRQYQLRDAGHLDEQRFAADVVQGERNHLHLTQGRRKNGGRPHPRAAAAVVIVRTRVSRRQLQCCAADPSQASSTTWVPAALASAAGLTHRLLDWPTIVPSG